MKFIHICDDKTTWAFPSYKLKWFNFNSVIEVAEFQFEDYHFRMKVDCFDTIHFLESLVNDKSGFYTISGSSNIPSITLEEFSSALFEESE